MKCVIFLSSYSKLTQNMHSEHQRLHCQQEFACIRLSFHCADNTFNLRAMLAFRYTVNRLYFLCDVCPVKWKQWRSNIGCGTTICSLANTVCGKSNPAPLYSVCVCEQRKPHSLVKHKTHSSNITHLGSVSSIVYRCYKRLLLLSLLSS